MCIYLEVFFGYGILSRKSEWFRQMSSVNFGVDVGAVCLEALELGYSRNYKKVSGGLIKGVKQGMKGRQDYRGPCMSQWGV